MQHRDGIYCLDARATSAVTRRRARTRRRRSHGRTTGRAHIEHAWLGKQSQKRCFYARVFDRTNARDGRTRRAEGGTSGRLTRVVVIVFLAQHTAKELASKAAAALTNKGGGKLGAKDRAGGAAGHAKYKCPICAQATPSQKNAQDHWDSKHSKLPFDFDDWSDLHKEHGGTTKGIGVAGGKAKTVHELQKTEAGRAELARIQAEKERIANLQF